MEASLKSYLNKCQSIFIAHRSNLPKVVPFPGTPESTKHDRQIFEKAIKAAENTEEFEGFVNAIATGPLKSDLERLITKKLNKKSKSKRKLKQPDPDKWRKNTTRQAARSFFRNTGTYFKLWHESIVDESDLLSILESYNKKSDSEIIRLFVFDGFVPYHDRKRLSNVRLSVGEFNKYSEKELADLLKLPQSLWHGMVNPEIIEKASIWNILTVREKDEYKGLTGLWIGGRLISNISLDEIGVPTKKESDIEIIGPIFLCIGEDANLAVEIRIKTNIFEYFPIYQKVRNDYLLWDSYDEEGEPKPRTHVHYLGKEADKLKKIFNIWQKINELDREGHLRFPTESYVRSVMNLHTSWESLMETFVGFITVIESLLTPGDRQELTYKMVVRAAALLSSDPEHRMTLYQTLNEFYKTRSRIVHEGRTDTKDLYEFNNMISHNLTEISRQIFLRYVCLLYLGINSELPLWILPEPEKLFSRKRRPATIGRILDSVVMDHRLTNQLEKRMEEWGVYEDWNRRVGLRLTRKMSQK